MGTDAEKSLRGFLCGLGYHFWNIVPFCDAPGWFGHRLSDHLELTIGKLSDDFTIGPEVKLGRFCFLCRWSDNLEKVGWITRFLNNLALGSVVKLWGGFLEQVQGFGDSRGV